MFTPATVITVFNWLLFLFCLSQMFPPPSFAFLTCMRSSSTVQLQPSRCKSLLPFGQDANENPPGSELLPYAHFKGGGGILRLTSIVFALMSLHLNIGTYVNLPLELQLHAGCDLLLLTSCGSVCEY